MTTEYATEFQPKTLKPSRSAPVRFIGRIIAETQWDTRDGCWMRFTVWETKGGAYITEIAGDAPGRPDQVHCTVGVVEPIYKPSDNSGWLQEINANLRGEQTAAAAFKELDQAIQQSPVRDDIAMQIAVLGHFDFHDRAKAMLKRELGWAPYIEVA